MKLSAKQCQMVQRRGTPEQFIDRLMNGPSAYSAGGMTAVGKQIYEYRDQWDAAAYGPVGPTLFVVENEISDAYKFFDHVDPTKLAHAAVNCSRARGGGFVTQIPVSSLDYRKGSPTDAAIEWSRLTGQIVITDDYGREYGITGYNVPDAWWDEFEAKVSEFWLPSEIKD